CPWRRLHVVCRLLPVRDRLDHPRRPGSDGIVRLRIPRRRAGRRVGRGIRRDHPRRRLDDLPARNIEIRRAAAVHLFRHHQADQAAHAGPRSQLAGVADLESGRAPEELPENLAEIEAGIAPAPVTPAGSAKAARGWRDYALLLMLACCWSSTYPLTKIGLGSIP